MDDPTTLDLAAALEVIEDLLREQLKTSGRIPETIVTVGGTALAALRIRERSDDVDLYMSEIDDAAIDTVTKKYRTRYGFDFKIDATPGNTIWGSFAIDDIDQSPTVATIEIGEVAVRIRALTPETLYLRIPMISPGCTDFDLAQDSKMISPTIPILMSPGA
jgi:hypothetical protein